MLVILALVNTGILISKVWASNPLEPIHYHMAFTAYGGVCLLQQVGSSKQ